MSDVVDSCNYIELQKNDILLIKILSDVLCVSAIFYSRYGLYLYSDDMLKMIHCSCCCCCCCSCCCYQYYYQIDLIYTGYIYSIDILILFPVSKQYHNNESIELLILKILSIILLNRTFFKAFFLFSKHHLRLLTMESYTTQTVLFMILIPIVNL